MLVVLWVAQGGVGRVAAGLDPVTTTGTVTELRDMGTIGYRYQVGSQTFTRDGSPMISGQADAGPAHLGAPVRVDYWKAHPGFSCVCDARAASQPFPKPSDLAIGATLFLLIPAALVSVGVFGYGQMRREFGP